MLRTRHVIQAGGWLRLPMSSQLQPSQEVEVRLLGDIVVISRPATAIRKEGSGRGPLQRRPQRANVGVRRIFKF